MEAMLNTNINTLYEPLSDGPNTREMIILVPIAKINVRPCEIKVIVLSLIKVDIFSSWID